ncbi:MULTISPECIES: class I SAM-dependent methyltransferase [Methylosinus]|uniref:Class I SAM-dependent methyltransferase n=2 Tax=Methylosinus trichosporium TaxID=426 RepID=A0A2D2CWE0_METT3|nr:MULTISPECIES: methyltransferase domain-containing protein [Methylosinus]ATQ66986.1 class I SAM-dependent methyltransferase [Methylosinus trichosporium OB3b]OBS54048.1 SAM-dependent methyltransferase [Methylosinus sp. 3S-1]
MNEDTHERRIVDQFTRWAERFAQLPIHAEAGAMARTIHACALRPGVEALDVACGPGILACAIAHQALHVTGVDITPAMITQAQARQRAEGLTNLAWRIGDAVALPFEDDVFDLVTTRYSLHHMKDPVSVLGEMKRVCRPAGRIVVIDATPSPATRVAYDEMERLRDPSHTCALDLEQIREIGRDFGLKEVVIDGYRLEAQLDALADASNLPALTAMFDSDIDAGRDRIGIGAWRSSTGIRFYFPISIVAWEI